MKKVFALLMVCALLLCSAFASAEGELISVGIVNNPPSESGYREANVEDFERSSPPRTAMTPRPSTA